MKCRVHASSAAPAPASGLGRGGSDPNFLRRAMSICVAVRRECVHWNCACLSVGARAVGRDAAHGHAGVRQRHAARQGLVRVRLQSCECSGHAYAQCSRGPQSPVTRASRRASRPRPRCWRPIVLAPAWRAGPAAAVTRDPGVYRHANQRVDDLRWPVGHVLALQVRVSGAGVLVDGNVGNRHGGAQPGERRPHVRLRMPALDHDAARIEPGERMCGRHTGKCHADRLAAAAGGTPSAPRG